MMKLITGTMMLGVAGSLAIGQTAGQTKPEEPAALKLQVAELQARVAALEVANAKLSAENSAFKSRLNTSDYPSKPTDPLPPNLDGSVDFPDALSFLRLQLRQDKLIRARKDLMPSERANLRTPLEGKLIQLTANVTDVITRDFEKIGRVVVVTEAKCQLGVVICRLNFTGADAAKAASFKKDQLINFVAEIKGQTGYGDSDNGYEYRMRRMLSIGRYKVH